MIGNPLLVSDILDLVFEKLGADDLLRAAAVCRFWKCRAYDEVRTRELQKASVERFRGDFRVTLLQNKEKVHTLASLCALKHCVLDLLRMQVPCYLPILHTFTCQKLWERMYERAWRIQVGSVRAPQGWERGRTWRESYRDRHLIHTRWMRRTYTDVELLDTYGYVGPIRLLNEVHASFFLSVKIKITNVSAMYAFLSVCGGGLDGFEDVAHIRECHRGPELNFT